MTWGRPFLWDTCSRPSRDLETKRQRCSVHDSSKATFFAELTKNYTRFSDLLKLGSSLWPIADTSPLIILPNFPSGIKEGFLILITAILINLIVVCPFCILSNCYVNLSVHRITTQIKAFHHCYNNNYYWVCYYYVCLFIFFSPLSISAISSDLV